MSYRLPVTEMILTSYNELRNINLFLLFHIHQTFASTIMIMVRKFFTLHLDRHEKIQCLVEDATGTLSGSVRSGAVIRIASSRELMMTVDKDTTGPLAI